MDQKISISGSILSGILIWWGKLSLSDMALIGGCLSGFATFGFTMYKWIITIIKNIKKSKTLQ